MEIRVYPEYYEGPLLHSGIEIYGEFTEEKFSRMKLLKDGNLEIFYDKQGVDGKNIKSINEFSPKIYEVGALAIGLICCLDINNGDIVRAIKEGLNNSNCEHEMIVISAYMTDRSWFSGDSVQPYLHGLYVILANGCNYGVSSFISTTTGKKLSDLELRFGDIRVLNCGIT